MAIRTSKSEATRGDKVADIFRFVSNSSCFVYFERGTWLILQAIPSLTARTKIQLMLSWSTGGDAGDPMCWLPVKFAMKLPSV